MSETIMIRCPNCGAEYPSTEETCPYCTEENKDLSGRQFSKIIDNRLDEISYVKEKPKRFVKSFRKSTIIIVLAVVALLLILGIRAFSAGEETVYDNPDAFVDELEAAVSAGDYEKMGEILETNSLYNGVYTGYQNLDSVYREYGRLEKYKAEMYEVMEDDVHYSTDEMKERSMAIDAGCAIEYALRARREAKEILAESTHYGTEDEIQELLDEVVSVMNEWGLDDERMDIIIAELEEDSFALQDDNSELSKCSVEVAKKILAEGK